MLPKELIISKVWVMSFVIIFCLLLLWWNVGVKENLREEARKTVDNIFHEFDSSRIG